MNILNKFNNLKISSVDFISDDDRVYCEHYQNIYFNTVRAYEGFKSTLEALVDLARTNPFNENILIDSRADIEPIDSRLVKLKEDFVNKLCRYFSGKYKVTISHDFIVKYSLSITYRNILDEIFLQMDGLNFKEKAEKEIKDNVRELVSRNNNDFKVSAKNNRLIFEDLDIVNYETIWRRYEIGSYSSNDNALRLFRALNYFDHKENSGELDRFLRTNEEKQPDIFNKYEFFEMNRLKSIKFYKKDRIVIEFNTVKDANEFLTEYCGVNIAEVL